MRKVLIFLWMCSPCTWAATPWEQFLEEPTPQNASQVNEIAYTQPVQGGYDSNDLEILRLQVLAADNEAFHLTYRLKGKSDGGLSEELGAILAAVVRPNPRFFLRQVSLLKQPCWKFDVDVAGLEYVDRPKAAAYELKKRHDSLASVNEKSLKNVRNECLARLDQKNK